MNICVKQKVNLMCQKVVEPCFATKVRMFYTISKSPLGTLILSVIDAYISLASHVKIGQLQITPK